MSASSTILAFQEALGIWRKLPCTARILQIMSMVCGVRVFRENPFRLYNMGESKTKVEYIVMLKKLHKIVRSKGR